MNQHDTPAKVASTDGLGPLVDAEMAEYSDGAYADHGSSRDQLQRFAAAVQAAERRRCASVLRYWLTGHAPAAGTYEAQCLEHVLDGRPAPTGWTERA